MPEGPKGEKRPADVIGAAITVAKLATGEIEEQTDDDGKDKAAVELGRKGGKAPTNDRFWLQADILMARNNVRYTPNSGH